MFGERLKDQVEERLKFYETGDVPRKNAEVMKAALEEHNTQVKLEKKSNKRKLEEAVNGTYIQTLPTFFTFSFFQFLTSTYCHCYCHSFCC